MPVRPTGRTRCLSHYPLQPKSRFARMTCATCGGVGQVRQVARTVLGQMVRTGTCPACQGRGFTVDHSML